MPNDKRAEPIAEALRRFLAGSGLSKRLEQTSALEAWPGVVGPAVAAVTRPLSVASDGTLFVAVRSAPWMNELTMMEADIVAALGRRNPSAPITRIRWQLAP